MKVGHLVIIKACTRRFFCSLKKTFLPVLNLTSINKHRFYLKHSRFVILTMSQKKLECFYCDAIFYSKEMRWRHHSLHSKNLDEIKENLQLFSCKYCLTSFPNLLVLGAHVKNDHKKLSRPFVCSEPHCSSSFTTERARQVHLKRHTINILAKQNKDKKQFNCKFCPKSFDSFQKVACHARQLHWKQTNKKEPQTI